jgi:methyl-accepting chemotaxis protein
MRDMLAQHVAGTDSDLARALKSQADHVRQHSETIGVAVAEHVAQVSVVAEQVRSITAAARQIDRLNAAARMLSFNARIEAARSRAGSVFSTIASEMQQLSRAIEGANQTVRELATGMEQAIPRLVEQGEALRKTVLDYAEDANERIARVDSRVEELQTAVAGSLAESDTANAEIVSESHGALSRLQFQDVCAQNLLQIDTWSEEMLRDAAETFGVEIDIEPAAHATLGGTDDVEAPAGQVLLF